MRMIILGAFDRFEKAVHRAKGSEEKKVKEVVATYPKTEHNKCRTVGKDVYSIALNLLLHLLNSSYFLSKSLLTVGRTCCFAFIISPNVMGGTVNFFFKTLVVSRSRKDAIAPSLHSVVMSAQL